MIEAKGQGSVHPIDQDASQPVNSALLDKDNMAGAIHGLPDQLDAAWARVAALEVPSEYHKPAAIVVAGMGGSAIAADIAASAYEPVLDCPMVISRDAVLPGWVDHRTLLIASSFSGNTTETLAAWEDAGTRGAKRIAITSGGALRESAESDSVPIVTLQPGGQPRAALGQSLACVLGVLRASGSIEDPGTEIEATSASMRALIESDAVIDGTPAVDAADSAALMPKRLARELEGRLPVIFAPLSLAPVGRRWKGQFAENAKLPSILEILPEAHHNAVEGLPALAGFGFGVGVCGLVLDGAETVDVRRIDATAALFKELGIPLHRIKTPQSGSRLADCLWLVQHADLTSLHLAHRRGVDPTPIPTILRLKDWLAG